MSKQKYTNYGSKFNQATTEAIVKDIAIPVVEVNDQAINEEVENVEPEVAPPAKMTTGIVTANKLNIRKLSSPGAEVTAIVDKNTELMIDPEYETVEWFKVYTAAGVEGYCMKKFVEIK